MHLKGLFLLLILTISVVPVLNFKIKLPKVRVPKIRLPEPRLGIKRGANKVAQAAEQAKVSIKETQDFINEEAWPELKGKLEEFSNLSGTAVKSLEKLDEFIDHASEVINLHTRTLGLVLMLLAALICRLVISSVQSREHGVCSSLQKSVFYALYILCILLAVYFALEVLFELGVLERGEDYRLIWLFIGVVPLLEALFCILWYVIRGVLTWLGRSLCWFGERLTFTVLCAAIALGVALYVGMREEVDADAATVE